MGRDMSSASADTEEDWYLVDYQRGQLKGFLDHIKEGVRLAAADPASLLIFSGGATRDDAGPRTEGMHCSESTTPFACCPGPASPFACCPGPASHGYAAGAAV